MDAALADAKINQLCGTHVPTAYVKVLATLTQALPVGPSRELEGPGSRLRVGILTPQSDGGQPEVRLILVAAAAGPLRHHCARRGQ